MATTAPKTVVSDVTVDGKRKITYSDGTVQIRNPGRAVGATVAPPPGPGGAPAAKENDPNKGAGGTTGIVTKPVETKLPATTTAPAATTNYSAMGPMALSDAIRKGDAGAKAEWEKRYGANGTTQGTQVVGEDPNYIKSLGPADLTTKEGINAALAANKIDVAQATAAANKLGLQHSTPAATTGAMAGTVTAGAGTGAGTGTAATTQPQTYTEGQTVEQGAKIYRNGQLIDTPIGTSLPGGYWDGTKVVPFTEGQTRGQGAEIYKNGQWVPNTLPSQEQKVENEIVAQDPSNAFSNAMALPLGVAEQFAPTPVSASDVAKEATGYGLDRFTNTDALRDEALRLAEQEQDAAREKAMMDFNNRYKGVGVSGIEMNRAGEMARDYALGKARTAQNIRQEYDQLGFQRNTALQNAAQNLSQGNQAMQGNIFSNVLGAAQGQSAQAVGALQQERARAYDQWKYMNQEQAITARGDADRNAANRQALWTALFSFLPKPTTPEQQAMLMQAQAIAKNAGIDYQPGTGNSGNIFDNILKSTGLDTLLPPGFDLNQVLNLAGQFGAIL